MTVIDAALTTSANHLFREMQKIVESRPTPLVEAYHSDFYKIDREILGSLIAPGGQLLWLLHPCGTHLGEVGILQGKDSYMSAVLKTYSTSYEAERLELYSISLADQAAGGQFKTIVRPITIEAGQSLLRATTGRYTMRNESLTKGGEAIATVSVRLGDPIRSESGYMTQIVSGKPMSRLDAIAAGMHANRIAATLAGRFVRELSCTVNGQPFDALYPRVEITPVVRGDLAPAEHVAVRERQAA